MTKGNNMGNNWKNLKKEKAEIMIYYLELIRDNYPKKRMKGGIRNVVTKWAFSRFPYLNKPDEQIGGSFDHPERGFLAKEFDFRKSTFEEDAENKNLTVVEYINEIIDKIKKKYSKFFDNKKNN